jgi:hypothetical protein
LMFTRGAPSLLETGPIQACQRSPTSQTRTGEDVCCKSHDHQWRRQRRKRRGSHDRPG